MLRRRWALRLALLALLAGLVVSYSGYVMAGSFTISNPDRLAYWQRVAMVYLGLAALSLVGIAAIVVALVRSGRGPSADLAAAGNAEPS